MNDLNRVDDLVISDATSVNSGAYAWETWVSQPRDAINMQNGLPMRLPSDGAPLVQGSASRQRHLVAKRVFDVLVSSAALLFLLPVFAIVATLIKLTSPGPVMFRQEREGYLGRSFYAWKFRSMRIEDCDVSGIAQTAKDDERVTSVGRLIRRTSIDELPQLINVLVGEMSLVGPRPHVAGMRAGGTTYQQLVPYYHRRLEMTPGLTGWAQANGLRGPTHRVDKARARIDHDIAYIQNFSFWLDLKIIVRTLAREFLGGSGH